MMRLLSGIFFAASALGAFVCVAAEENIVDHITSTGNNSVTQPYALRILLDKAIVPDEKSTDSSEQNVNTTSRNRSAGYRVQVFSDNNQRTAKNEARSKSRNISQRFPEYRTYVTYTSPYWRLRVGDFRTQQEAEEVAEELRSAFPSYSKEIRVVRDRISVQGYGN